MTEKEKEEFIKIMQGVNNAQNAEINGHFEAIKVELLYIKEKGDKTLEQAIHTNGRVSKHDIDIALMLNDKKNWMQNLAYRVVVLGIALISSYVTINAVSSIIIANNKTQNIEIKADNKVQDTRIKDNKDAINEQGVENAFQYNKMENELENN